MITIRERNDYERNSHFVGRDNEIDVFKTLIEALPPQKNVMSIFGVGGIGKSTLLRRFSLMAMTNSIPRALVEISNTKSSLDIMKEVAAQLPGDHFKIFKNKLSGYYAIETKIQGHLNRSKDGGIAFLENISVYGMPVGAASVNLFGKDKLRSLVGKLITPQDLDNYNNAVLLLQQSFIAGLNLICENHLGILFLDTFEEAVDEVQEWLSSLITNGLCENYLIVVAGRDSILGASRFWNDNRKIVKEVRLGALGTIECEELLRKLGIIDPNIINGILDFTGRLPWAIELTVESLTAVEFDAHDLNPGTTKELIGQKVVDRFLTQIKKNKPLSILVKVCSVFNEFSADLIHYVLKAIEVEHISIEELHKYSFFKFHANGSYSLHDIVREFVELDFRNKETETWKRVHNSAAAYFSLKAKRETPYGGQYFKTKIDEFSHLIKTREDDAILLLIDVVKYIIGPVMFSEFYNPIIAIAEGLGLSKKNKTTMTYFEAQLAAVQHDDLKAIRLYKSIDDDFIMNFGLTFVIKAKLSDILYRLGQMNQAYEVALKALELAEKEKQFDFAALFAVKIAEIYGSKGALRNSERYCQITSNYLGSVDDDFIKGEIQLLLAHIYLFRNDYIKGELALNLALSSWKAIHYDYGVAQVQSSMCWMAALKGNWEEGKQLGIKAYEYFNTFEDRYFSGLAALNIAQLYYLKGNYLKALEWNGTAHKNLEYSSMLYDAISLLQSGMCHIKLNDWHSAISLLNAGRELESKVDEKYTLGLLLFHLSIAQKKIGVQEDAKINFSEAEKLLRVCQNNHGFLSLHLLQMKEVIEDYNRFSQTHGEISNTIDTSNFFDLKSELYYLRFKSTLVSYIKKNDSILPIEQLLTMAMQCFSTALIYNPHFLYNIVETVLLDISQLSHENRYLLLRAFEAEWIREPTGDGEQALVDIEFKKRIIELGSDAFDVPEFLDRIQRNI